MCPEAHGQLRDFRHSRRCNRLRLMALQTVQVSVEPRLSTVLKDRSVVPSSKRLSLCTFPDSVVFVHRAGRFAKGYPLYIQAVLEGRNVAIRKGNKEKNINLVYFSCLKHANKVLLGDQRQTDQRSFHLPSSFIIHSALLLEHSSAKLLVFTYTGALHILRMGRRIGLWSTCCWGNHMHDHSRF